MWRRGIFYKGASRSIGGGAQRSSSAAAEPSGPPEGKSGGPRRRERALLATRLLGKGPFDGNSFALHIAGITGRLKDATLARTRCRRIAHPVTSASPNGAQPDRQ